MKDNVSASELFFSKEPIYKSWDYRCLAPYSHKDPDLWGTYDVQAYRKAYDKKTMEKVNINKFDKYFNNFIDPNVWSEFLESPTKMWWKSYDLPTAVHRPRGTSDSIKCHMMCMKMVSLHILKWLSIVYKH